MNRESLLRILRVLGADKVAVRQNQNVEFCCLLAPYRHKSGRDQHPSMGARWGLEVSKVNCFACGYGGTVETLLRELLLHVRGSGREPVERALRMAEEAEREGAIQGADDFPPYEEPPEEGPDPVVPEAELDPYRGWAHPYILGRGFRPETLRRWEIGYDDRRQRIVLPVRDHRGALRGAIGRAVRRDQQPRFWTYWGLRKSRRLYGEHFLRRGPVVVTEAPLDAVRIWQEHDLRGAPIQVAAIMGAKASVTQVELLIRYGDPLVAFFDRDEAGDQALQHLTRALRGRARLLAVDYDGIDEAALDPSRLGPDATLRDLKDADALARAGLDLVGFVRAADLIL